jgi:hypothetical protein
MALYLKGQSPCQNATPCGRILKITYDWAGTGMADLDTGTEFLGSKVGYDCPGGGSYMRFITGDDTGVNGKELVEIEVDRALADGAWTSTVLINLFAHWYPAGSDKQGTITIKAKTVKGILCSDESAEQTKTVYINERSSNCATYFAGNITYSSSGTFILN